MNPIDALEDEGQRLLVSLLVTDREAASLLLADADPAYFDGRAEQWLIGYAQRFFQQHRDVLPTTLLVPAVEADIVQGTLPAELADEIGAAYGALAQRLADPSDQALRPALLAAAPDWLRQRAVLRVMTEAADSVTRGKEIPDLQSRVAKAMAVGVSTGDALRYVARDVDAFFDALVAQKKLPRIGFGLPPIDRAIGGGIGPGMLGAILAGTGRGKSHLLQWIGLCQVRNGKRVLHVSLEMGEEEVFLRYAAGITGIDSVAIREDPEVARTRARQRVADWGADIRLLVRPARSLSVQTLSAALERIAITEEFRPDVLVVDYADLLVGGSKEDKEYTEQRIVYEELRGLAQRLHVPVWTATQTNRAGHAKHGLSLNEIGNSYDKARVCDLLVAWEGDEDDRIGAVQYGTLRPIKVRGATVGNAVSCALDMKVSALTAASRPEMTADAPSVLAVGL